MSSWRIPPPVLFSIAVSPHSSGNYKLGFEVLKTSPSGNPLSDIDAIMVSASLAHYSLVQNLAMSPKLDVLPAKCCIAS